MKQKTTPTKPVEVLSLILINLTLFSAFIGIISHFRAMIPDLSLGSQLLETFSLLACMFFLTVNIIPSIVIVASAKHQAPDFADRTAIMAAISLILPLIVIILFLILLFGPNADMLWLVALLVILVSALISDITYASRIKHSGTTPQPPSYTGNPHIIQYKEDSDLDEDV